MLNVKPMRRALLCLLLTYCSTIVSQNWGEDVFAAAQTAVAENKYLLVVFYNEDKSVKEYLHQVSGDTNVAHVVHKKYIPVQINAFRKDSVHWISKFLIDQLPSMIVMTRDFQIYDKSVGYKPLAGEGSVIEFLESSKRKIRNQDAWTGYSKTLVMENPAAMNHYFQDHQGKLPSEEDLKAFWDTCKDYYSEHSFKMMYYFGGSEQANQFFVDSFLEFKQKFGFDDSYRIKREIAKNRIRPFIREKNRLAYLDATDKAKSLIYPLEHDRFEEEVRAEWILENAMWNQYLTMMEKQRQADPEKNFGVYQYGIIADNCKDKDVLKTAKDWLEEDLEKDSSLQNQIDYVKLLYKLKEKKAIIPAIEKAIANSIKAGYDTSGLEAMLTQAKDGL